MLYVDGIVPVGMMANCPPPMAKSIFFHSSNRKPNRKRTLFYRIIALAFCSFHKGVFIRRIAQPPANSSTDCSLSLSPSCIQSLGVVFNFFSLLYPFLLYPNPDISIPETLLPSGFRVCPSSPAYSIYSWAWPTTSPPSIIQPHHY